MGGREDSSYVILENLDFVKKTEGCAVKEAMAVMQRLAENERIHRN